MNTPGPIRVLHLRDSPWVDGPGRTIIESAARFDPMIVDYYIGVFVPAPDAGHPMIDEAVSRGLQVLTIVDRGGIDRQAVAAILDCVDRLHIDILHTSDFRSRLYGRLVCRRRRNLQHVTTTHGWIANTLKERMRRLLDKMLLRGTDHVVMVSHAMRRLVPRWWLPDRRVTVLHNAIVTTERHQAGNRPVRIEPDVMRRAVLMNVGRLSPEKGQELLLRATAEVLREFPGIRLRIAGIGPCKEALQAVAADLNLGDRVRFMGYVKDMTSLYSEVDLVVQSSLTEGLPNVILEAAVNGVPVVATDVGGTREVIEHGVNGWLIEPGSVEALVDGLRCYLLAPANFMRMAAAGRNQIASTFSYGARTARMVAIYSDLKMSRA